MKTKPDPLWAYHLRIEARDQRSDGKGEMADIMNDAASLIEEVLTTKKPEPFGPEDKPMTDFERGWTAGWDLAHEPAKCGHARANHKDPNYGTPEYKGDEQCEVCALLAPSPVMERDHRAMNVLRESKRNLMHEHVSKNWIFGQLGVKCGIAKDPATAILAPQEGDHDG